MSKKWTDDNEGNANKQAKISRRNALIAGAGLGLATVLSFEEVREALSGNDGTGSPGDADGTPASTPYPETPDDPGPSGAYVGMLEECDGMAPDERERAAGYLEQKAYENGYGPEDFETRYDENGALIVEAPDPVFKGNYAISFNCK